MELSKFTCTSDKPYDRHTYRVYLKSEKFLNFEHYEEVQAYWFTHNQIPDYLDVIEVLDKSKKKVKSKGFK
jgi:hypothetical protein